MSLFPQRCSSISHCGGLLVMAELGMSSSSVLAQLTSSDFHPTTCQKQPEHHIVFPRSNISVFLQLSSLAVKIPLSWMQVMCGSYLQPGYDAAFNETVQSSYPAADNTSGQLHVFFGREVLGSFSTVIRIPVPFLIVCCDFTPHWHTGLPLCLPLPLSFPPSNVLPARP